MKIIARVALPVAIVLIAAACGSESTDPTASSTGSDTTPTAAAPSTTEDSMTGDVAPEGPQAIISLSSTATEMLFAIGAGDQVIAVDSFSNYPPEAPLTDLAAFEPNLEAIASYNPDLVVLSYDPGEVVAGLDALGIKTILQDAAHDLDEVYAQIAELGVVTGQIDGAAAVNAEIREGVEAAVAAAPKIEQPIRVYHEIDDTFYSATSSTFIGQMYEMLGMVNVADAADADGSNFGFPQLSPEYLIEADPEMIVITDQSGYGAAEISARPGWGIISAVKNDNVVQVSADISSRWGPRIVLFLEEIAAALAATPVSK